LYRSPSGEMLVLWERASHPRLSETESERILRRPERIGVMVARGDLTVECGFERLPEVQEEILCVCDAAYVPVIWATQVLDQMARTGQPSRAEISDAAMASRAERVMPNKGPHIVQAVEALDDILRRMSTRQRKMVALLRRLRSWSSRVPPRNR
jgi:pyruvate kinase